MVHACHCGVMIDLRPRLIHPYTLIKREHKKAHDIFQIAGEI